MGVPMFEFFNITQELNCKKVFIRDIDQCWYHKGLGSFLISNIFELKEYIEELIGISKATKVVLVGNSMGGYASLIIGRILNHHNVRVITFNPQTFIGKDNFEMFKELRWKNEMENLPLVSDPALLNLNYFYKQNKSIGGEYEIHYSHTDREHAEIMKDIDGVELIKYKLDSSVDDHELVKILRNENKLLDILGKGLDER
ncbi:hypothetical protein [Paenibacillus sp. PAMC 26794]|uniref:hypothetical protein n=1 Tax=Paenibacillus sp. PAMC 26794 TaxID=1257080 RepID=UPI00187C3380|nr:hypothetical protein [Paenibacillus sp. PAMC 26794]